MWSRAKSTTTPTITDLEKKSPGVASDGSGQNDAFPQPSLPIRKPSFYSVPTVDPADNNVPQWSVEEDSNTYDQGMTSPSPSQTSQKLSSRAKQYLNHSHSDSPSVPESPKLNLENVSAQDIAGGNGQQNLPPSPSEPSSGEKAAPVNPLMDSDQFPDGGSKAWLTVAGASACLFVSFGWINCIGVFQDYYQTHQLAQYTPSTIAWIPALQVFFMLFGGPFVGLFFDNFGPQYLLMLGTFFHVFGLMMVSLSKEYYQFLLSQAVCSAIGASMVFYPSFTCVSTWFFKKRGAALGPVAAGSSLGGVIFPIMVTHLIPQVGFGWTMRICAFLILALLLFAIMTVRSRIPPSRRPFHISAFIRPLREPTFALLTAAIFFFFWGMFVPFTFIVAEARSKGMGLTLANYLVAILNAASVLGRTVPNIIADKVGRFNVMIVMSAFTSIVILALWIPASSNVALIFFAALFGVASGAGIGLTPVLVASVSPIQDIGIRTGTVFFFSSFAALTGSPIGGQIIIDSLGSFRNCKIFAGVSCGIGFCLFIGARISVGGLKIGKF